MSEEFSKIGMEEIYGKYGKLVCEDCKETMRPLGQKVADRLNAGKKPRMRDIIKLQNCLCRSCHYAIYNKKMEEGAWKH